MCTAMQFWSISLSLLLSLSAFASPIDEANGLFLKRSKGVKYIKEAKDIYTRIIKSSKESSDLRREALDKYGRLSVYEGQTARDQFATTEKAAQKIFEDCIELTENLNPKKAGELFVEYVYWRAACIGLWAANSSTGKIMIHKGRINEMESLVETGLANFKTYDSFAFNRIQAGIYLRNTKASKTFGYYHPDKALILLHETLSNGATDVFLNYIMKAEAEIVLDQNDVAVKTLETGINKLQARFKAKNIPEDLIEDNKIYLTAMQTRLVEVTK